MIIQNFEDYAAFDYENNFSSSDNYLLGNVVINDENEIGVIIQVHGDGEYRTDMFGNCSESEIRMATDDEIIMYRPNILKEGTLKKEKSQGSRLVEVTITENWIEKIWEYMTSENHKDVASKLPLKSVRIFNPRFREIETTGRYYRITENKKGGKSFIFEIIE
jgi:hypothetical protein